MIIKNDLIHETSKPLKLLTNANTYIFAFLFCIYIFVYSSNSYAVSNVSCSNVKLVPGDSLTNDSLKIIIPDSNTAIKIGMVILSTIYGEKYIKRCRPFTAILIDGDTWKVYGSLYKYYTVGGEPVVLLSRKDARVKDVYHTR